MIIWTFDDIVDEPEPPTREAIARATKRQLDSLQELRERLIKGERPQVAIG